MNNAETILFKNVTPEIRKLVEQGNLRIGSTKYYKQIETTDPRHDHAGGLPDLIIHGSERLISYEEADEMFRTLGGSLPKTKFGAIKLEGDATLSFVSPYNATIFCMSQRQNPKFGPHSFKLRSIQKFESAVAKVVLEKFREYLPVLYRNLPKEDVPNIIGIWHCNRAIEYKDGKTDFVTWKNGRPVFTDRMALEKSTKFEDEREHRFIFNPIVQYENGKSEISVMPAEFEYFDVHIDGLANLIEWIV